MFMRVCRYLWRRPWWVKILFSFLLLCNVVAFSDLEHWDWSLYYTLFITVPISYLLLRPWSKGWWRQLMRPTALQVRYAKRIEAWALQKEAESLARTNFNRAQQGKAPSWKARQQQNPQFMEIYNAKWLELYNTEWPAIYKTKKQTLATQDPNNNPPQN